MDLLRADGKIDEKKLATAITEIEGGTVNLPQPQVTEVLNVGLSILANQVEPWQAAELIGRHSVVAEEDDAEEG